MPIVWGIIAVGGLFGLGYAADKTEGAANASAQLAKWGAVAGAVYIAYGLSKSGGLIK